MMLCAGTASHSSTSIIKSALAMAILPFNLIGERIVEATQDGAVLECSRIAFERGLILYAASVDWYQNLIVYISFVTDNDNCTILTPPVWSIGTTY